MRGHDGSHHPTINLSPRPPRYRAPLVSFGIRVKVAYDVGGLPVSSPHDARRVNSCLYCAKSHSRCDASIFAARFSTTPEDTPPAEDDRGEGLEEVVRDEQEYLRQRLRDELKREPTDEEMDEWLRRHTEGY